MADGGVVRVSETRGPFVLTVFSSPTPLRVGPADISVLVQRGGSREPILDAEVEVQLAQQGSTITAPATRDAATNKLLYAANVVLPTAGAWSLRTVVRHASATAEVSIAIVVDPPVSSVGAFWMYFALPLLVIALFVAHQWLSSRRQPGTSESHTHS